MILGLLRIHVNILVTYRVRADELGAQYDGVLPSDVSLDGLLGCKSRVPK